MAKTPKWTILYDFFSTDGYSTNVREFFDTKEAADEAAKLHAPPGEATCTRRPYHEWDAPWLRYHKSEI